MREGWNRATPVFQLSKKEVETLLHPILPSLKVTEVEIAKGGLANTNLKIQRAEEEQPLLLRFCVRDPSSVVREFRLLELVGAAVAAPHIWHFSRENPINGHPFILMDWIDGVRLETVIDRLSREEIWQLGESLGETLAAIHGFKFEQAGFFDEKLDITSPMEMNGAGLLAYARQCLADAVAVERLGWQLATELLKFLEEENSLLNEWDGKPCLTHADFNGSNILVKNAPEGWKVAAVLDWEFAFSGTPFFDFGNLLRDPLGALPGMADSVASGYTKAGGILPEKWRKMSKLTDLTAWLEFLTRENTGPQLISDCRDQISKTIGKW